MVEIKGSHGKGEIMVDFPRFQGCLSFKALKADLKVWNEEVWSDRKSFFWMSYEIVIFWKKKEVYVMRRKLGRLKLLVIWRDLLFWRR